MGTPDRPTLLFALLALLLGAVALVGTAGVCWCGVHGVDPPRDLTTLTSAAISGLVGTLAGLRPPGNGGRPAPPGP